MGPPVEKQRSGGAGAGANGNQNNMEMLLDDDSLSGGGIVNGAEESFDFNPPEAVSAHAAATGFDAEFTDTVVHE